MRTAKWMKRFWKDFTQKEFVTIKILFFLLFGGMTTLFPFLTIQARSLGITVEELGIIYSILPVVGVLAPALVGMCADSLGNFKIFLVIMMSLSGLASLLFLLIPTGRITHILPEELPLVLNCDKTGQSLQIKEPFTCLYKNISLVQMRVKVCKYFCTHNVETQLSVELLNETWCSVTKNCDMLRSNNVNEDVFNDANLWPNPFVTFQARLHHRNLTEPLQMSHQICRKLMDKTEVYNYNKTNDAVKTTQACWLQCDVTARSRTLCSNSESIEILNPFMTLTLYIIIRLINGFTLSSTFPLFEGAVVAILKEFNGDFGYQRMFGNLGMLIMPPISGKLIDLASSITGKEDYRPAFYMYCGIKFLCAFVICFMNLKFKRPSKTVVKDVKTLVANPRVIAFLIFTLVSGICWGFTETFLFWLMDDMDADKSLMGLTVTFGAVFGIPLLMCSSYIIKRLGHVGTLSLSMSVFVIRLVGYSFIQNPWHAMPFEAMESFTNSLKGVAAVSYTAVLSSPSTVASLQGIYGGMYHGIGRGVGSLIGGFLIKGVGIRATFQILAVVAAAASGGYFAVHWFIFRRGDINKEEQRNKLEMEEGKVEGESKMSKKNIDEGDVVTK